MEWIFNVGERTSTAFDRSTLVVTQCKAYSCRAESTQQSHDETFNIHKVVVHGQYDLAASRMYFEL